MSFDSYGDPLPSRDKPQGDLELTGGIPPGMTDFLTVHEGAGKSYANWAAPGYNGSPTGTPAWATVPDGGLGVYCTGGSSADIPDHGNIVAGDFAVRAVFTPISWPNAFSVIFGKWTNGSTTAGELNLYLGTSGNISFMKFNSSNTALALTTGFSLNAVCELIWSRSGSTNSFYCNGAVKGTSTDGTTSTGAGGSAFRFGRDPSAANGDSDAHLHCLQIFNRSLSAAEVAELYLDRWKWITQAEVDSAGSVIAAVASTVVFRKTLSGIGSRTGSRQVHGW